MVKSKNSGSVLVKLLSRFATLASICFLVACASSGLSSREAAQLWEQKYDACTDMAEQNNADFPVNDWFDSLSFEDKRSVIGYIYNYNQNLCTSTEIQQLKESLDKDGDKQVAFQYKEVIEPLDVQSQNRMKNIDKHEVMLIQGHFSQPFSVRHVLTQLNLYSK